MQLAKFIILIILNINVAYASPCSKRIAKDITPAIYVKISKSISNYKQEPNKSIRLLENITGRTTLDKAYINKLLSELYTQIKNYNKAKEKLILVISANELGFDDHLQSLKLYADLLIQDKEYSKALSFYKQALNFSCNKDKKLYENMAYASYELKKWQDAINMAQKAPFSNLSAHILVNSYYQLNNYKEAINILKQLINKTQTNHDVKNINNIWLQLIQFYILDQNIKKALATYELAKKQNFLNQDEIKNLILLLSQKKLYLEAAQILSQQQNKSIEDLNLLANLYLHAKELKLAANSYERLFLVTNDSDYILKQVQVLTSYLVKDYSYALSSLNKINLDDKNYTIAQDKIIQIQKILTTYN